MSADVTTQSVVVHGLVAACREMSVLIRRASRSTIVREAEDFSTAILDPLGRLVAQADSIPLHLNSLQMAFAYCLAAYPAETWKAGHVVLNNDPYSGGQHLPDIFAFRAIHDDRSKLLGFTGCIAHHNDVGGSVGSLNPDATDVHEEGLRIPPVRLDVESWLDSPFGRVLLANSRTPDSVAADVRSQVSALGLGVQRVRRLAARYSSDTVLEVMQGVLDDGERRMRDLLESLPDGTYYGEDWIDSDGKGGEPLKVEAHVTIRGDSALIDFTGTSPQAKGFVNATLASAVSGVYTALKCILREAGLPTNAGIFAPLELRIPEGCLLNPRYPSAIRSRMNASCRAYGAVLMALTRACPERGAACGFDTTTCVNLGHLDSEGRYRILIDPIRGGLGATLGSDGASAISQIISNSRNTPAEAIEAEMPFLRVVRYELIPGSGGAGAWRGGNGCVREYEALADGVSVNYSTDRERVAAWGIEGGDSGEPGSLTLIPRCGGAARLPVSGGRAVLQRGDRLVVRTGGGGGFGAAAGPEAKGD